MKPTARPTMKFVTHQSAKADGSSVSSDFTPVLQALREITKALKENTDKPKVTVTLPQTQIHNDVKVPFPEIHNEFVVPSPKVDIYPQAAENNITVNPTPISVSLPAMQVDNHVHCVPPNLRSVVVSIYVLSGVIGASAIGLIASLFLR